MSALTAGYRPLPGVPDEMMDGAGAIRPHWAGLMDHLARTPPDGLAQAAARGAQYLADAGVFFRRYGDSTVAARDWPWTPLPILMTESEWTGIAEGLIQRAEVLEGFVADLYGPGRLVAEGHLPAALVAENPAWLRPLVGVRPRSGHFLHFAAFEIGRGPDGRWWVLGDRTEAPSGAGFALENRVAATRAFPDLFAASHVHRLAGFFGAFRDALAGHAGAAGARAAILTPGPLTDTYYKQAYIARYLGLPLLEGGDLSVEDGAVSVRTIAGPKPIDVLWRRMDAIWADPLELDETSWLGTPGLVSAVRQGRVGLVNALGAGVLETQGFLPFLPGIARALTGRELAMPHIATWWCGGAAEIAHVRARAERLMIGPALATRLPFDGTAPHAIAGALHGAPGETLKGWLARDPASLVAQELVTLSTTPVWEDGRLIPRPMSIRMFLARTAEGWAVMPGGFARVGRSADPMAISMQAGGSVADVWVIGDRPAPAVTLLGAQAAPFVRARPGPLPTRAADNLYWLGRYVERTEGLMRLARAAHARRAEGSGQGPLVAVVSTLLETYGVAADEAVPQGLRETLAQAVTAASQIRDRFSVDGWAALADMEKSLDRIGGTARPGLDAALALSVMLRKLAGFAGLVHENMIRGDGWRFLTMGRALERAAMMAEVLSVLADEVAPSGGLDLAIEFGDSAMTHRQRYAVATTRGAVVDLLALDPENPRSVRFNLAEIGAQAGLVAEGSDAFRRFAARVEGVETALAARSPDRLTTESLRALSVDIAALSVALTNACLA